MPTERTEITIAYSTDAQLGDVDPEAENIDVNESCRKYERNLAAALRKMYPGANIHFIRDINDYIEVDGRRDSIECEFVAGAVNDAWTDWDWVVYNE